ncbi:hypothetical protein [Halarcobacter ebronensis]|uniref:Stringent starvation protein B n=1 Tax=Halarcobacter ebronensis TaxID=1462615 RepID=A0A4Q1AIC0_9BACT|nr:hypothetical protein [Halarcobacter ebronensis]QKF83102.1 hypothetical protein AEBR_2646 [Halarcobacter ebronensis]RXK01401.1 hypothetical protein CRV07_15100 [Halarcobacter ebronensis]
MISKIIENSDYKELVSKQVKETIEFLLAENQEFAITANIDPIRFEPSLPNTIFNQLSKFSLFVLSNYTYSTVKLDEEFIYFEAGFGSENFGSNVKIPLHSIFQIIVDESILFINSVATVDKFNKDPKSKSFNAFKNNPNNKNLLK